MDEIFFHQICIWSSYNVYMSILATKIVTILVTNCILPCGTHVYYATLHLHSLCGTQVQTQAMWHMSRPRCHMALNLFRSTHAMWDLGVNKCHVPLLGLAQVITQARPKLKPCGTQARFKLMPLRLGLELTHMASIKNTIFLFGFN